MLTNFIRTNFIRKLLLIAILLEFGCSASANPGDTTWVTVFNLQKLTHHGNYDTSATFPTGKRYRKIRLHYILGRYACPGNPQYCGSWDYTTQIFARPAGKDSVEVARVITPYASDWLTLNKKHDYIVDVTDYASILDGNTGMRFRYDGYSWGFTITLKIEFIEGVPPMDASSVRNVYKGYFPYGNSSNPIENYLTEKTYSYTTPRAFIKNSISGHGADNTNCAEFCNKYYQLLIDNSLYAQRQLWRDDCGVNQVYPQTGTWVYNRSNWCPGAVVWPIYHDLIMITAPNSPFSVNINMQPYVSSSNPGGYIYETQLIDYSAPNHTVDVAIEDVISPTFNENYFRNNPACVTPMIRIRNTGQDLVYNVAFEYGLSGLTLSTYTWMGALGFLQETDVIFPPSLPVMSQSTSLPFEFRITDVNNSGPDNYALNDVYRTVTRPVAVYPSSFVINTITNASTNQGTGKNQTSWSLFDDNGNLILSRTLMNNSTQYNDTVDLAQGCYKFEITDTGCDGIAWWANPNGGSGVIRFKNLLNPQYYFEPKGDFGCELTKYFRVGDAPPPPPPLNWQSLSENLLQSQVDLYPNPSTETAYLRVDLRRAQKMKYCVTDIAGRIILNKDLGRTDQVFESIDISSLANGVYNLRLDSEGQNSITKKLIIQR